MKKLLIKAIQACINSYEGKHGKVKKMFDKWVKFEVNKNIEYYFGYKGKVLWIVFRGTDEWKDWAQNLETKAIDIDDGKMHLGFYEDNIRVQAHCFKEIKRFDTIFITGHSKGADQAAVLSYFSQKKFPNKRIVPLLIAPAKCMSKKLAAKFKNTYTIINGEDFVCKIPHFKFKHVGKVVRIGKRNMFFWIPFVRIFGAWAYHYPQKYLTEMIKYNKTI